MGHLPEPPAPPPRRAHREVPPRRDVLERDFLAKVEQSDGFWEAVGGLSTYAGKPIQDLEAYAQQLCRCCYAEASQIAAGDAQLAAARSEVERLKDKLTQSNLSSMKQLTAFRTGNMAGGELGEDTVTFYEPLQYLEEDTRDLVFHIVCEKVRLLETGRAPSSLIEALTKYASGKAAPAQDARAEELAEELEDARVLMKEIRARTERAEDDAAEARRLQVQAEVRVHEMAKEVAAAQEEVAAAEAKVAAAQSQIAEAERALADLQGQYDELQEQSDKQQVELERQQEELGRQREELAKNQAEIQQQRAELARRSEEIEQLRTEVAQAAEEIKKERQASAQVRTELEKERQVSAKLREEARLLEMEFRNLQHRHEALEKEASEMREELARRNSGTSHGTQTSLTMVKLDEQAEERKRMKVMLEELQMKLKELLEKCRRQGIGDSVAQIAADLGLQDVLKERTVFQRLYDDAVNRAHRLEKLREKIQKERKELWPGGTTPRSAAIETKGSDWQAQSVLDNIGDSKLTGLQSLVKEGKVDKERYVVEAVPSAEPPAPQARLTEARSKLVPPVSFMQAQQGGLGMSPQQHKHVKTATSLPALPRAAQGATVVMLGLGGERGSFKPRQSLRERF